MTRFPRAANAAVAAMCAIVFFGTAPAGLMFLLWAYWVGAVGTWAALGFGTMLLAFSLLTVCAAAGAASTIRRRG